MAGDGDDDDFHLLMMRWEYMVSMVIVMSVKMREMTVSDFAHDD